MTFLWVRAVIHLSVSRKYVLTLSPLLRFSQADKNFAVKLGVGLPGLRSDHSAIADCHFLAVDPAGPFHFDRHVLMEDNLIIRARKLA